MGYHPKYLGRTYLSYLQGKTSIRGERRFAVRAFHPCGHYPRGIIAQTESLYYADDEIVFSTTLTSLTRPHEEEAPYTEMEWINPDELRFLASIYLCEIEGGAKLTFYPIATIR
jgi:hypothetical protein